MQQGIILLLLPLLLPSLSCLFTELVIFHKLLGIFTINLVCSHCHLISQIGEALEGGHCGHTTISLEETSKESAKNLNLFFYFYSSICHVTLLSESKVLKGIGQ